MNTTTTYTLAAAALMALLSGCVEQNITPRPDLDDFTPGMIEPLQCVPNLDERIDSDELVEALGVPVTYLVNPANEERSVDIRGLENASGDRLWDWSDAPTGDQVAEVTASSLTGKWYAPSFPDGQFVVPADLGARVENIYRRDEQGFYLLGIASAEENPDEGQTLLVYDRPVALYLFPLEAGDVWTSVGEVRNGTFLGVTPYAGRDTYEIRVEAVGELQLPDLIFDQALQVFTKVTISPAVGTAVSTRQVSFLSECSGEVARATSKNNETEAFFTTAQEVRRVGIGR